MLPAVLKKALWGKHSIYLLLTFPFSPYLLKLLNKKHYLMLIICM